MSFNFLKKTTFTLIIMLALDMIWIKLVAGRFYAEQLTQIGRFDSSGQFDARLTPAVLAYVIMAFALEYFVLSKPDRHLKDQIISGAILGFCLFGVYDLTNRAIIESYPMSMVVVDMFWGVILYSMTTAINGMIRKSIFFLK